MKSLFTFFSIFCLCVSVWAQEPTIIKDVNAEEGDGVPVPYMAAFSYTQYIVKHNGLIFFAADDGTNGIELWKTDGTDAGTELVKDINEGSGGSDCRSMYAVGDYILFEADNGTNGRELWRSDGTEAGTQMVLDINAGVADGVFLKNALIWNDLLYFAADDGMNGVSLWRSDGTETGTVLLVNVGPGNMALHDGKLFFGNSGLWVSDGTEAGTDLLKADIVPKHLVSAEDYLIFAGAGELTNHEPWRSDGTEAGTVLIKEINPDEASITCPSFPRDEKLIKMGDAVYFEANDGTGRELWRTDGTEAGTYMVKDVSDQNISDCAKGFVVLEDVLYYGFNDGESGYELWRSDGTESGTYMVKDILAGMPGALLPIHQEHIAAIGDRLYFGAGVEFPNDMQLWESDGTEEGTQLLAELEGGGLGTMGIAPQHFIELDDHIVFAADVDGFGFELWKYPLEMTNDNEVISQEKKVMVFPSITSGQFSVRTIGEWSLDGQFDVEMFNLSGTVVKQWQDVTQNENLNVQGLSDGTYLLKVTDNTGVAVEKIIIKNN